MSGVRESYTDVGRAMRVAIDRAAEAEVPRACHVTLEAVFALVASYSRLEDDISIEQLARAARLHPKTVERALHRLRDLGIVDYVGGRGRSNVSRIGLPPVEEKGTSRGSPLRSEKGVAGDVKGDGQEHKRESLRPRQYREDFREDSRGSDGAARGAPPLLIDDCMRCGVRRECRDDGKRVLCIECSEGIAC